jgi:hypothetical protein
MSKTRVCIVSSPPAFSATAFIVGAHSDSREAVKRVPIEMPAAPSASVESFPQGRPVISTLAIFRRLPPARAKAGMPASG